MELHIGIDDTDSTRGGCTTYIAARLVEKLAKIPVTFIDYPNIIRLNPNIPYKTRGNAAVALRLDIQDSDYNSIKELVLEEVERNSHIGTKGTDPAVIFLKDRSPPAKLKKFSENALWQILTGTEALRTIKTCGAEAAAYSGNLGLVGALAAVGQSMDGDHTFELIAYRKKENYCKPRRVNEESVKKMDELTFPGTFNNYDYSNRRVLLTPRGPDPVLLGVRGESARIVLEGFRMLTIREPVERWVIFRTNHGTDAHLMQVSGKQYINRNSPTVINGIVANKPLRTRGGHVFFKLAYKHRTVHCAAFEPTGRFREHVASLLPGDLVTVYGGVKEPRGKLPLTVNLEKIRINRLINQVLIENPACPTCSKHMKSAGRSGGFRCKRCNLNAPKAIKRIIKIPRPVQAGWYLPTLKAHRHLTKPLSRYGVEKPHSKHNPPLWRWHEP